MPYSTVALVVAEFRTLDISATTAITTSDVNGFITETDSVIDGYIGSRYTTPIDSGTSPLSFAILQMISRQLVALRIKEILEVKNVSKEAARQDVRGGLSRADLYKMLNDIKGGSIVLSDALLAAGGSHMSSFNATNSIEPFFKRDTNQW